MPAASTATGINRQYFQYFGIRVFISGTFSDIMEAL
jgi:hypothetical protein